MSVASHMIDALEFARTKTLATLDEIAKLPDPASVLCWQPGPGRAHIGWQLTHIGITEEITATERLHGLQPNWPDLVPRFKFGSVPNQNVPDIGTIRTILDVSRSHLIPCLAAIKDEDLETIPTWYRERGWTLRRLMQILIWHEAHHQGQAHITFNLWKASH